jgi:hypothetical protein
VSLAPSGNRKWDFVVTVFQKLFEEIWGGLLSVEHELKFVGCSEVDEEVVLFWLGRGAHYIMYAYIVLLEHP